MVEILRPGGVYRDNNGLIWYASNENTMHNVDLTGVPNPRPVAVTPEHLNKMEQIDRNLSSGLPVVTLPEVIDNTELLRAIANCISTNVESLPKCIKQICAQYSTSTSDLAKTIYTIATWYSNTG